MNILIFDNAGLLHMATSDIPNEDYLDDTKWTIAELPEDEPFDSEYEYSLVDGLAVKGDLIAIDIDAEARLRAEYEATKYQQEREYPPIGDQLDALFHAGAFPAEMAAKIQAVKDAHPKPAENK